MKKVKCLIALFLVSLASSAFASQWSYFGAKGPHYWGSITPGFSACAKGEQQSPIDLGRAQPLKDDHLSLHYRSSAFELRQSPHNLYQDSVKPGKDYLTYNGQRYNLVEIHFHVPSEHRLNGKQFPMEVHLVHQNSKNELLVLGVFLKKGAANSYLGALLSSPQFLALNEEVQQVLELNPLLLNPGDLLGRAKEYYTYAGSLTTPPCVEGVTWLVAKEPVELSVSQLNAFKKQVISFNARPLQKLNGRGLGFEG